MDMKYTAQEMRQMAGSIVYERSVEYFPDVEKIAAMLRQAADMMEREEKREYEYSVYPPEVNGVFKYRAGAELKALLLKQNGYSDKTIVRREVGEWEEVE